MRRLWVLAIVVLCSGRLHAQHNTLRQEISRIVGEAEGKVGVSILNLEEGDTISFNGKEHFPMQSVFKFPIGMAVLHKVDQGKLSLEEKIQVLKKDLHKTYSPLRDKYPEGNVAISVKEMLQYMVSLSDNNACDLLLEKISGTVTVEAYLHQLGINAIAVKANEYEMSTAWDVQYRNWCEPVAMVQLLKKFYEKKVLSKASSDLLWKMMVETPTGMARIKGLLPEGTTVAHKTGTSSTNEKGITAATNDVGIIMLPSGKHLALAVFVSDCANDAKTREAVIAKIARATWNEFAK